MKKTLTIIFVMIKLMCFSQTFNEDGSAILDSTKRLQTDVFILNSCSPNQIAIRRGNDNADKNKYVPLRKLELNVNKFSAFKIINVNPLRYNYYINNQFITQFFDASDISFGNFTRDTANLPINDIEVLEVFKTDNPMETQRAKLNESKKQIKLYEDSIFTINSKLYEIYDMINNLTNVQENLLKDNKERSLNNKERQIRDSLTTISRNLYKQLPSRALQDQLENYDETIKNLTINNDIKSILDDIANNFSDSTTLTFNNSISINAQNTENKLLALDKLVDMLPAFLSISSDKPFNKKNSPNNPSPSLEQLMSQLETVKVFALNKGFAIDKEQLISGNLNERKLEIYKAKEFVSDEKIKVAEAFLIFASLQIGKLLQNEVIDCSRFQNQIKDETCLGNREKDIAMKIKHVSALYKYIQDVSANLNVLIKYLELNNPAFNSTVSNINSNYKMLLKYLKTFDFVVKNNTKNFTLPSHNNLKNIDIVRYSIERKDKLTGSVEPYNYDIWIKGGLKVDFSIAVLMSKIKDEQYNKIPVFTSSKDSLGNISTGDSKDSFYIKKADNGKFDFAFGGMVNIMWRTGASWVSPGASIGIAYSASQKLQFLAAGSLQFGKSERLIAHFGMSAGLAKRLDKSQLAYTEISKDTYKVKGDMGTITVPYLDVFQFKPFFGISYNLSKRNALNAVGTGNDNFNAAFPK